MNVVKDINWSKYYRKPPKATLLKGTPFYCGTLNMVYGLSKSGKSRSLAELLINANLNNNEKTVVWLDKDYNIDEYMLKVLAEFKHSNHNVDTLCKELLKKDSLDEYILVFDSLKDFSEFGLDSNKDAQNTMEYIRQFTKLGATVILIAHATEIIKDGKVIGFKVQGNSETIKSKCDCVFRFEVTESKKYEIIVRSFIPEAMRISNASKDKFQIYDKDMLINAIHTCIDNEDKLTQRELKKKFSSSMSSAIDDLEDVAYSVEQVGTSKVVSKIQSMS